MLIFPVFSGAIVLFDVRHASPVWGRASEETGAGGSRGGEKRTVGAPQREAAVQGPASCRTGRQGAQSGRAADIPAGITQRIQAAAEGGRFAVRVCVCSSSITTAERRCAERRHQERDPGLHQEEEPGGDGHLSGLTYCETSHTRQMKSSCSSKRCHRWQCEYYREHKGQVGKGLKNGYLRNSTNANFLD